MQFAVAHDVCHETAGRWSRSYPSSSSPPVHASFHGRRDAAVLRVPTHRPPCRLVASRRGTLEPERLLTRGLYGDLPAPSSLLLLMLSSSGITKMSKDIEMFLQRGFGQPHLAWPPPMKRRPPTAAMVEEANLAELSSTRHVATDKLTARSASREHRVRRSWLDSASSVSIRAVQLARRSSTHSCSLATSP